MSNKPIELKGGNFTLPVVHLHNIKPEFIRQALEEKIAQAPSFLKQAFVVVNISDLNTPIDWQHLHQIFTDIGLRIVGVSGCKNADLKAEINHSGLPILIENKNKNDHSIFREKEILPFQEQNNITLGKKTRFIDVPVRSGQRIYAPNSDLIVTSNVSAGTELIADGNIHVYGMMRGRVLAGARGDQDAQIFCTYLTAELISIAGIYWLSDKIPAELYGKAVRLRLLENSLTAQPLN